MKSNYQTSIGNRVKGRYTTKEEWMHVGTHATGVLFILFLSSGLLARSDNMGMRWGLTMYTLTFFFTFLTSAVYHGLAPGGTKIFWRKLDHIAIYFFILGSNAPFLLGLAGGEGGGKFFLMMLLLVIAGVIYKMFGADRWPWFSLFFYLLLGWLGVVTIWLVYSQIESREFALIVLGGLLYSAGAYFYAKDDRRWYHAIWHAFVLVAALTHFAAIWIIAAAA